MIQEITMPQLAESVVSATIVKWLKKPGDFIEEFEPLCEIMTEKVTAELPSTVEGFLQEILSEEGATVDVGTVICNIKVKQDESESIAQGDSSVAPQKESLEMKHSMSDTDQSMRNRYSPAVQRIAAENNIDLNLVSGTGIGGRITRKDVMNVVEDNAEDHNASISSQAVLAPEKKEAEAVRTTGLHLSEPPRSTVEKNQREADNEYFIDVTPVRSSIASNMRHSVTEIPHAWTMVEVDVTNLVNLRNKVKQEFISKEGVNLTYLAFIIKAVVNAIKDYPILNSVWAVNKIIVKKDINISLAVGTEDSVYVPVIKHADHKTIAGIAKEIDSLTKKARAGKLTLNDMQDGTFTLNNTGAFGSILSNPIINYPQAANLTFESIVKKPVVIDDMIAVRSMVNMCLSLDHRILDGVICGRFLQRVKENIESFGPDTKLY
ncbi:dihydrolipoamide acetyltransferase family protein [Chengkuizengella axinellae]|uniref:Dihydrolipoamide acetyltransferase component of pyruvate dehydrogenase complex n=1 Tax=Chengkuizengella axinellae TaxID=3064388 RepID=A0ABT9IW84_9BACL|nr:dihydrolipoamide acetyltransferase family protein [Chengkuizengella sp. 2205SS18-9]MDP5273626.1 dihydrolipoamide acetyltransferase family protein [Chengkuizengella sp. 2205SS18-9]